MQLACQRAKPHVYHRVLGSARACSRAGSEATTAGRGARPLAAEAVICVGFEGLAAIVGQVTGPVHLILYVRDQVAATAFWQAVLDRRPDLDVSGMTEFPPGTQVVLGLMPEAGIRSGRAPQAQSQGLV